MGTVFPCTKLDQYKILNNKYLDIACALIITIFIIFLGIDLATYIIFPLSYSNGMFLLLLFTARC